MRLVQLATFLSLGAGSLALLLPPSDTFQDDAVKDHGLSSEAAAIAQLTQSLRVGCDSCPFPSGHADANSFTNTPNDLVLTLALDPDHRDTITLNGKPLFPAIYTRDVIMPYTATQKSLVDGQEFQVPIDLDLFIETDSTGLSRLRLHVLGVSGWKTLATMSILEFPVFQNQGGEVFIGEVHIRPPTPAEASAVMCKDNFICRWKAYLYDTAQQIAAKVSSHRKGGCHGKKYKRPPHANGQEQQPKHGHADEHQNQNHGNSYEHKWRWFKWVGIIVRLVLACLVIAAITITVGLFFTLVVSSVIHVLISTWTFARTRSCPFKRQAAADEEAQGLMSKAEESQLEAAGEYTDDLPVYSEGQEKQ
ncbi:hypothetical protein DRE_02692 [Drechslerella stenobrocha 248]|uniref:Uncharacterized protein n=1 Tax=Drechslerella stenobrocha 248 TaxID=1043628 RepID=W7I730_9PEZI|nr:hypothetical protein DRE_02692 [Drechslerella stenobrocha 248]